MHGVKAFYKKYPSLIFPTILFIILTIFTSLGISGTSVGVLNTKLYGENYKDPSLIAGSPRSVRSDEYLVVTQLTVIQANNNFDRYNYDLNGKKDMSLVVDVPYKEWSIVFKPQNLGFFVLPLENAFALKWWLLIFLLMIGIYYFSLRFLKGKYLLASLLALGLSFAPYVWWWYQTTTIAPLFYGLFIILICMNILDAKKLSFFERQLSIKTSAVIYSVVLCYLLICFALIFYPPFQIPVALVVLLFMIGYLMNNNLRKKQFKKLAFRLVGVIVALVVALGVLGVFMSTRSEAISMITNTAYPGKRTATSGDYDFRNLLVTYLQPQLQTESGGDYLSNQSASSNFIVTPWVLAVPMAISVYVTYRRSKRLDWVAIMLLLCTILFLAHLLAPAFSPINPIFLLNLVPAERILIGLGFLAIIQLVYITKTIPQNIKKRRFFAFDYSAAVFVVSVYYGFIATQLYPKFISNMALVVVLALTFSGIVLLFSLQRYTVGAALLALFSFGSIAFINPLYRGLDPLTSPRITSEIKRVSNDDDLWGYSGLLYFENLPQIANRQAMTGILFYPNTDFWEQYATEPYQEEIFNRYAHVQLYNSPSELSLVQADFFVASYRCEMDVMRDVDYIISSTGIDSACTEKVGEVVYPKTTFYLYKVLKP